MNRLFSPLVVALLALVPLAASPAPAADGYYRTPDLHGDTVVFAAEGDLWTVPVSGGTARRLTTHVGAEFYPRFSPDGTRVAFSGQYDGNTDVYVVDSTGGEPVRLTWHPGGDTVIGWTPDGKRILFRSRRSHPHGSGEMWSVAIEGGDPEPLGLGRVARLAVDPVSGAYALNRTNRETSTWKRYRGGTAPEIWVGHPGRDDFRNVTEFDGVDMMPMWRAGRIWYVSDRGGTLNLWSMLPDGSDRTRHTEHEDWDVRWPEMSPDGRIVFELGADLWRFDPADGEERQIAVDLPSERTLTRTRYPDAGRYLTSFELSPKGDRLAVVTRGEIFSVPVEEGVTLPVSRGSGARESGATFGPKGEKLYFVTDASREELVSSIDSWGRGEAEVLEKGSPERWHFPPRVSPDGKRIAFGDQTHTLFVMDAAGGTPKAIDRSEQDEIRSYAWSPDGRYLAYAKASRTEFSSVFVHDTRTGDIHRITSDDTNDYSPAWDPDGRWLHFLSDRTVNPFLDGRDFQNVTIRPTKPYLVLLQADAEHPFLPREGLPPGEDEEDEEDDAEEGKDEKKDKKDKKKDEEKLEPVEIDWEGLADRLVEIPVDPGEYGSLDATDSHLFYLSWPIRGMREPGGSPGPKAKLVAFDLEEEEAKTFVSGVSGYDLRAKAGKIAIMKKRGDLYVVGTGSPPGDDLSESSVSLEDVVIELDPREEWEQIYYEGWRHMRDFFWTEDMAGVDWPAVRDRYAGLLPRLGTRGDLTDLMGEVIGELATSHTYRWGGDRGARAETRSTGLLGADLVRDGSAYRVERILRGAPTDLDRSPLDVPGAVVREGEYIVAVNRRPLDPTRPFPANLDNLAGRPVLLSVNDRPSLDGAREVVVEPVSSERRLRYIDWVRRNREAVAEATDGKIGYLHLPDMGSTGLVEFNRWFYPQTDREGMIVDCRWNGGGFVSQMILERFRRKIVSWDRSRGGGVYTYPSRTLNGPFVVLLNEEAGSDGDIFPYAVQYEGLAPVIGVRSWGGVVGYRGDKSLVDGGALTQPEYAWWDSERGWAIENHGVDPDIVVVNPPHEEGRGKDAQLERGIAEVMRLHRENPPEVPDFDATPIPDKSREGFRRRELE